MFVTMIETTKEKVFDIVFDIIKEKIKGAKEKKDLKEFAQNYFDAYFKDINFNDEFDFQLVTEYLLNNYEKIFKNNSPQDAMNEIIAGAVARGNGNEYQIKRYCSIFYHSGSQS